MHPARALVLLTSLLLSSFALAAPVIQVPEGGRAVEVVEKGVVCGPVRGGWSLASDGRSIQPPAKADDGERTLELKVAESAALCAASQSTVTVIATGPLPRVDAAGTTFYPDDGRLELRGTNLQNAGVAWSGTPRGGEPHPARLEGQDVCLAPSPASARAPTDCVVPVAQGLPTDAALYVLPSHGRWGPEVTTYDAGGNAVDAEALRIRPGRVVLTQPLVRSSGIDVSKGPGSVAVSHSEAIATVDCGLARCEVGEGVLFVRNVPGVDATVNLRLRLSPRVLFARGDALEQVLTAALPVAGLPALRHGGHGAARRRGLRAGGAARLRLRARPARAALDGQQPALPLERVVQTAEGSHVLLRTGGTSDPQVTITALTSRQDGTVVATATAKTLPVPIPRAVLQLPGHGPIDFDPHQPPAEVRVAGAPGAGRFAAPPAVRRLRRHGAGRHTAHPGRAHRRRLRDAALRLPAPDAARGAGHHGPDPHRGARPAAGARGQRARPAGAPAGVRLRGQGREGPGPGAEPAPPDSL
ncbi:hypothetical protein ACLESO_11655 [Pyxidicoccus sp. 3LG]